MRVRLGTVIVDERTRRAIAHAHGEARKASRAECRVFLVKHSAAELAAVLDAFDALTEPKLPFIDHEARASL